MDYRLYLVTGNYDFEESTFLPIIEKALQYGVSIVQLREKTGTTRSIYQRALKVKALTDRYQVPLIINDRVDLCLAIDAAGVHLGDEDLPAFVARKMIGSDKILGVSAKTVSAALEAQNDGADYLGVGALFPTQTKDTPLTKMATLHAIKQQVRIPVVAIGGIKEDTIPCFNNTRIDGVAIVSEIMQAKDVSGKVKALRQSIDQALGDEAK